MFLLDRKQCTQDSNVMAKEEQNDKQKKDT